MSFRRCVVPQCTSSSVRNPEKLFVNVPMNPERRKKWFQLAQRELDSLSAKTKISMCEDHFDMEKVIANYMQFKLGFSNRLVLAPDALPTKFSCQDPKKPITDSRYAQQDIQECWQSRNATDDHVENSQMEPETDIYVIEGCEIVEIDGMHFIVELEGKDSNLGTVSNEELEQSPEECQPYVPFEEVYIKQEVDPDLSIVPKVELEELPEEWQPNEPFEEIYIKQEPEENGESLVGGEQLNGFNKEPEEDVEVQVKDEPLNGFKTEISEDLGIVTEDDLPEECQPEIQFETVYVD